MNCTGSDDTMWRTWANLLTALRLATIGPCAWAISTGAWGLAGALFALAVLTDLLDGPVARHLNHASSLGGLLDHATDALFVSACLAALAAVGQMNVLLPALVLLAFLQYMLDSSALAGASLRTSRLGRYNGIAYFVLVGIPVVSNALALGWPPVEWVRLLGWALTLSTLASMGDRLLALRRVGREPQPPASS